MRRYFISSQKSKIHYFDLRLLMFKAKKNICEASLHFLFKKKIHWSKQHGVQCILSTLLTACMSCVVFRPISILRGSQNLLIVLGLKYILPNIQATQLKRLYHRVVIA
jgi:hypothetical protein